MKTSWIPARLKGPARVVRDAVRAARAPDGRIIPARRRARSHAAVAPRGRADRRHLRAHVLASARVTAGLSRQWELTDRHPDLVLVEVDAALEAPTSDLLAGQRRAVLAATSPVVVWVTASQHVAAEALTRLLEGVVAPVHVVVDDAASVDAWVAALARPVHHLGPAADPAVHSPVVLGSAGLRDPAVAVVGDGDFTVRRLAPIKPDLVDIMVGDEDTATGLPGDRPVLGHYRAVALVADRPRTAWHAVEAAATGTALIVIGAVTRVPAEIRCHSCPVADDTQLRQQAKAHLWQGEYADRNAVPAARAVRAGHTFAHRAAELESLVGRPRPVGGGRPGAPFDRTVSAVISTNRAHELDTVVENMVRQSIAVDGDLQIVLVMHGLDVPVARVEARFRDAGLEQVVALPADSSLTLGACLNLGIEASDGKHIAKIDDDNFYGRHYLQDLVDAVDYSGAGIVGKWAHYTWLRSTGAVILRSPEAEHSYQRLVQGGSILMREEVARDLPFSDIPRAVDTDLLNRARAHGISTYSADRFNFVSIRGTDPLAHTWTVEDATFMNKASRVVFYGDPREHVDL